MVFTQLCWVLFKATYNGTAITYKQTTYASLSISMLTAIKYCLIKLYHVLFMHKQYLQKRTVKIKCSPSITRTEPALPDAVWSSETFL